MQTMYSSSGWDAFAWGFKAEAHQVVVSFHNPAQDKEDPACGPLLDSVALKLLSNAKRPKGESAISQAVRTTPGKTYVLTFSIGDARDQCVGSLAVEAYAGATKVQVAYKSLGKGGFKKGVLQFKALKDRTRITFTSSYYTMKNDNTGVLCGPVLDDVKLVSARYPRKFM
ncbi:Protein DUF642 L-GALACTONO-1,4-LACTONE-RESPONSIVE GENE 1 [Linum perenne]